MFDYCLLPLSLPEQLKSVVYNWYDLILLSIEVADALALFHVNSEPAYSVAVNGILNHIKY